MKAILVIDVPVLDDGRHLCNECPIWNDEHFFCEYDFNMKTKGCPLKPMPEKYIEHDITIETERDAAVCSHGITLGHNDVIEELEKPETKSDLSTDEGWWRDYMLYEMQND